MLIKLRNSANTVFLYMYVYTITQGKNLGISLMNTHYQFPYQWQNLPFFLFKSKYSTCVMLVSCSASVQGGIVAPMTNCCETSLTCEALFMHVSQNVQCNITIHISLVPSSPSPQVGGAWERC